MAIKIIVGVGNAGKKYELHRHNIGFILVELLASMYASDFKKETKFCALVAKINVGVHCVSLVKLNTYVNCCGQYVQKIASFYKVAVEDILVLHDDIDLPLGVARFKSAGGHGGHNGLKDIINCLASNNFKRLRIGIGRPSDKRTVIDFVLSQPSTFEFEIIQKSMKKILNVIEDIIIGDNNIAMNKLHANKL